MSTDQSKPVEEATAPSPEELSPSETPADEPVEEAAAPSPEEPPSGDAPADDEKESPKRKRRWLRMLLWLFLIGFVCLALFIAFLPAILSSGAVTRRIAAGASDYLDRDVSIGDLSIGWRSGIKVTDVSVLERDGSPFASLKSMTCDIGLLSLMRGRIAVRDLSIIEPKLVVRRDKDGHLNIENMGKLGQAKAPEVEDEPEPEKDESGRLPDTLIHAKVVDGAFDFEDLATGETVSIRDFNVVLEVPSINDLISFSLDFDLSQGGRTESVGLKAEAQVAENNELLTDRAKVSVDFTSVPVQASMKLDMAQLDGSPDGKGVEFTLQCDLAELMERIGLIIGLPDGMQIAGTIKSELVAAGDLEESVGLKGSTAISGFAVTGGPLADMPVRQDTVRSVLDVTMALKGRHSGVVVINSLTVEAPALNVDVSGKASGLGEQGNLQGTVKVDADLPEIVGLVSGFLPPELTLGGHARMTMAASTSLEALSSIDKAAAAANPFAYLGVVALDGSIAVDRAEYSSADTQLVFSDMRLQPITLSNSILAVEGQFKANDGPGTLRARIDFTDPEPSFDTTIGAQDVVLTQRVSLLGYVIPLLILPVDGKIQSSASFQADLKGEGFAWETLREKLEASGKLELGDGTISGGEILGAVLKLTGQREQFEFNGMSTQFGLSEGKITSDAIQVNSRALSFALQGWTSIVPDPETGGFAMEYKPGKEILRKYAGKEYERIMALLGTQGEDYSPLVIGGLVQKPRVELKLPGLGSAAQGLIGGALDDALGGKLGKGTNTGDGDAKKEAVKGAAGLLKGLLR